MQEFKVLFNLILFSDQFELELYNASRLVLIKISQNHLYIYVGFYLNLIHNYLKLKKNKSMRIRV